MADAFAIEVHAGLGVDSHVVKLGGGHEANTSEQSKGWILGGLKPSFVMYKFAKTASGAGAIGRLTISGTPV
jgi:hypothetical protein